MDPFRRYQTSWNMDQVFGTSSLKLEESDFMMALMTQMRDQNNAT